ncbi:hypothetical protein FBU30_001481 [Linnemannia zychae]|nr:hypothetical protein FBU30_001481 [Linnemannia zychae]
MTFQIFKPMSGTDSSTFCIYPQDESSENGKNQDRPLLLRPKISANGLELHLLAHNTSLKSFKKTRDKPTGKVENDNDDSDDNIVEIEDG